MDAFERVVAQLLEKQNFWVRTSYQVNLTADDKRRIGRPTSPRWEIDVVAYNPKNKEILAVECKSFLNSSGVQLSGLKNENQRYAERYKLFVDANLREVVFSRLQDQLEGDGLCQAGATVKLCLAAGKVAGNQDADLSKYCKEKGWPLYDREWFEKGMRGLAGSRYENEVSTVVAKLILRDVKQPAEEPE